MRAQPTPGPVAEGVPRRRPTTHRDRAETAAIVAASAVYAAFLLKLLLFSRAPGSQRSVNLVPFATIAHYFPTIAHYAVSHAPGAGRVGFANVVGNIVVFIPLGVYASWLRRRPAARLTLLTVTSVSVAVEITQGVLAVGSSDIDDVILNCVGGLIGILAFRLLSAVVRGRRQVRSVMAVLSLLSLPVWCFFLVVVRLRM